MDKKENLEEVKVEVNEEMLKELTDEELEAVAGGIPQIVYDLQDKYGKIVMQHFLRYGLAWVKEHYL